jgi:hypothetical protein
MRASVSKMGLCLSLLLLVSLSGFSTRGWSGEPPCNYVDDNSAPTVTMILTVVKQPPENGFDTGSAWVTFQGLCNGKFVYKKFCQGLFDVNFASIKKTDLEQLPPFGDFGFPECASSCGGEPMKITKVNSFINTGSKIIAGITMKFQTCQ